MASGEAQFNTNCWIRGRMVAMTGTFSGTFSTDVADIVSAVNIRNGSVSSYISFSFPAPGGVRANTKEIEFTIPAQEYGIVTDITIPAVITLGGDPRSFNMWLYRNGVLIEQTSLVNGSADEDDIGAMRALRNINSFRIMDFEVPINEPVTYRFLLGSGSSTRGKAAGDAPTWHTVDAWFSGKAIVAIRKR